MQQNPQNLKSEELTEIKNKLLALLPDGVEPKEIIKEGTVTVYVTMNSIPFRESTYSRIDDLQALIDCYYRIHEAIKEKIEDPEGKRFKARQAFMNQWMENISNGVGDANGETIPSNKQVVERLKRDGF